MPSTTLTCNKDARIAETSDLGAGASDYLPVGLYSGYKYRALLGFSGFSASWVSITSAVLHIRTSSQYYVAFGSDPDIKVLRLTSSWSEGSSVSLSGSNAVTWSNQPSATATNQATKDVTTSENTWVTVDITDLMQDALAAGVFYGIRIMANSESSSADVTEFYAREYGSYDAYIDVDYTTNTAPSAPTVSAPTASQIVTPTPTITFAHNDSDGDSLLKYDLQVSTDSTFASVTHFNGSLLTAGISGDTVTGTYGTTWAGTALTRGTTYYVRARTYSDAGILTAGAWSAARAFVANSLPTTALTEPGATGRTARLTYTPGAGWASPRLVLTWSYADAQPSHATQVKYQVFIKNDADGSTFYDSGEVTSSAQTLTVPTTLTEGNKYRVKVQVYDGLEWSGYSTELTVRARWGVWLGRYDMTAAPTTLALNTLNTTTGASSEVKVEYSTNTTTSTPSTFYDAVGSVPLQRYFFYRAYLYAWGSATPTSPSLDKLSIDYSTTIYVPDDWTRSDTSGSVIVADPGSYVYGSRSLRISANGSKYAYQRVPILPDTDYVLQGRMKSSGNSAGRFFLADTPTGTPLVASSTMAATQDFARETLTVWNSGSRTSVYVVCEASGSSGTYAWFDALKLEASTVATPWSPGFVAGAIAIDAGGLQVDGSAGGIFRLRGSTGGSRDLVELGTHGLKFGGDIEVYSPAAKRVLLGDASYARGGTAFPGSPSSGDIYWRTDLGMDFYYDGTRWLSTTLFRADIPERAATNVNWIGGITASTTASTRGPVPTPMGGSDIYLVDCILTFDVSGGTALSGSHKWVGTVDKNDAAGVTTTITTFTINSGATSTYRRTINSINALLGTTYFTWQSSWTKTGTPGGLLHGIEFTYRIVAT